MSTGKKVPGAVGGQGRAQGETVGETLPTSHAYCTHSPADVKPEKADSTGGVPRPEENEDLEVILAPQHLAMLRDGSRISDECIRARGYRTVTERSELAALGFSPRQQRVPGLLLPLHTTDGGNTVSVYRPDNPRVIEQRNKGKLADGTYPCKVIKYEIPKGTGVRLDCPPSCQPKLADPSVPLWITEGQKKADALASQGLCAIALLGVWNFKGRNLFGGTTLLADFDYIALGGRDVRLTFDSDVTTNPQVRAALDRLAEHLQRKKAHIGRLYLPNGPGVSKLGVDDWLAQGHTVQELEDLVKAPRPSPRPAPPVIEFLNAPPPELRRPLGLVNDRAYAATWLPVRVTRTEGTDDNGNIIKYDPPIEETSTDLFVIRDDGATFGSITGKSVESLDALGLEVVLPEVPPADRRWSTPGVKAYRSGARPSPVDVFNRVTDVVDRFVDFNRSFADQRTMAEMVACYTLSTWFLDAFKVIGYLWPNGDRGSGKTILLNTVAEMAYLGRVILAGGSYATLRDLADYGATLAFDDAENLSDPRKSDPDKRALLLAGNRRGTTITVKEPAPDRTWRTRYVNAFCPRLFSAIRLPDNVLASRTVVVPLIRTVDRNRANADPLDYELWPHDRRQLVDDLWALALAHLPELPDHERTVSREATLAGRALEPWKAILTVAHWLSENGAEGLWERMNELSVAYQRERPELEVDDFTVLVIKALCAKCANLANRANPQGDPFLVTSSAVAEVARTIAEEEDSPIKGDRITPQRVGMVFRTMRLEKPPRSGGKGRRSWAVSLGDLKHWTAAYGLPLPDEFQEHKGPSPQVGTVGEVGPVGPDDEAALWEGEL